MDQLRTYTKKEARMYLVGMAGQNIIYNVVNTGLYFYFQNVICLPAVALGWIFALARVWDAINDPMMGVIVDHTHSKHGKCKPYLMYVPLAIFIITCAAFFNGNYAELKMAGETTKSIFVVVWAAISYVLWGMTYTVGDIPLWGVISRMTEVEEDRVKLISWARIAAAIGAAMSLVTIVAISQGVNGALHLPDNAQKGFIIVGVAFTAVGCLLFECTGLGVKEHVRLTNGEQSKGFIDSMKIVWSCKPFRRLMISGVLRSPIALFNNIIITLATYYYCDGNLMNILQGGKILVVVLIFALGYALGMFGSTLIVPVLMKKWDVKKLYNSTAFSAIPMVLLFVCYVGLPDGSFKEIGWGALIGVLVLLSGTGQGIVNVCQSVMITDCIDYEEYHTGYRPDGVFFSGQSFITKLSSGVASLISAYVFAYVGYTDVNIAKMNEALNAGASFAADYSTYSWAMWFLVTVPAGIGLALAVIPTLKYEITPESRKEMSAALKIKHDEAEAVLLAQEAAEAETETETTSE